MIQSFQRKRARKKLDWIRRAYPAIERSKYILDLGCAEGFLGESCQIDFGAEIRLADVVDMNKTDLDLDLYDGEVLSYSDKKFDVCLLVFVLHHTNDARAVLREAARVSESLIVIESVFKTDWDLKQLTFLDKLFNRIRSSGKMNDQEEHLYFRKTAHWLELFEELGLSVLKLEERGRIFHQQSLFVLTVH